jgi:YD repeat-containing protein
MKRYSAVLALLACISVTQAQETGLITRSSKYSVAETTSRLVAAIEASGTYKLFWQLDHAANAQREGGAALPPSQLVLFGNPKAGAPLIKEAPTLALDLPNRALVWQDAGGKVWVTYNDLGALFARHNLKRSAEQLKAIEARQAALFEKATD